MSALAKVGLVAVALTAAAYVTDLPSGHADTGSSGAIPAHYLSLYKRSADTCRHLDWALLAAVGKVESDHGRSPLHGVRSGANSAGARGPMQFLPATFADVRSRHHDVGGDIYDPADAIPAAAHYLCDSGVARGSVSKALYAYNHSSVYVAKVRAQAARYR